MHVIHGVPALPAEQLFSTQNIGDVRHFTGDELNHVLRELSREDWHTAQSICANLRLVQEHRSWSKPTLTRAINALRYAQRDKLAVISSPAHGYKVATHSVEAKNFQRRELLAAGTRLTNATVLGSSGVSAMQAAEMREKNDILNVALSVINVLMP